MSELIPHEHMPIDQWLGLLWSGRMELGYGGARAPQEPSPVELPSVDRVVDYHDEICAAVQGAQELARTIAAERHPQESELATTAFLRHGTGVEEMPGGTMYVLNLMTELMVAFRSFYQRFCALGRTIPCRDPYLIGLADRVVRLRLLIIAIQAQAHVDETVDRYIVRYVTRLLP